MNRRLLSGIGLIGLGSFMFAACSGDGTHGTGGGSIQPATKVSGLYVANGDDSIARVDVSRGAVQTFKIGKEPSRVAANSEHVYASLRNERAVIVLDETGSTLSVTNRIETGAEPFGLAASDQHVYVAASVSGLVTEYDAKTLRAQRSWQITGEPRWVTLHPSHDALYVGSAYGGLLTYINLRDGSSRAIALPEVQGRSFMIGQSFTFARRITGDVAVAPNGSHIFVPMLYVDNVTTIPDMGSGSRCGRTGPPPPGMSGMTGGSGTSPGPGAPVPPGMGCGGYDQQKFIPVVAQVAIDPSGSPRTTPAPEAIQLTAFSPNSGRQISGYPAALAVTEDSEIVLAAIEGAEAVLAFRVGSAGQSQSPIPTMGGPASGPHPSVPAGVRGSGFSNRLAVSIATGAGPRGIAALDGRRAFVHAAFDRKVQEINLEQVHDALFNSPMLNAKPAGAPSTTTGAPSGGSSSMRPPSSNEQSRSQGLTVTSNFETSANRLSPDVEEGRRLFYATNDPAMSTVGAAVSCATCHFDGRTDGLTWHFQRGPRQTPMLAVNLEHALPVGWAGNVATVADEGFNTSQQLMGGHGLQPSQAQSMEKFLYSLRAVDTPLKGSSDPRVRRGLQVFASVGCLSCHAGASYTNNQTYSMLGLEKVKTRPLVSIAASAPYFHDGTADTLREVIDRASTGAMGSPFRISEDEKSDLVAFLQSL